MTEALARKAHRRWMANLPQAVIVSILAAEVPTYADVLDEVIDDEGERIANIHDIGVRNAAMRANPGASR